MEMLDVVDEKGEPTGQMVERSYAHAHDIPHRTPHVWIFRRKDGVTEVLMQKRSPGKDSFPGCYDISSAGHIPAGSGFVDSALRELWEELGVKAEPQDLHFCADLRLHSKNIFHGKPFLDNQYSRIFILWRDLDPADMTLQESEVSQVRWFPFNQVLEDARKGKYPCLYMQELEDLAAALEK